MPPKAAASSNKPLCQYHAKGHCKRGAQCPLRHASRPTAPKVSEEEVVATWGPVVRGVRVRADLPPMNSFERQVNGS